MQKRRIGRTDLYVSQDLPRHHDLGRSRTPRPKAMPRWTSPSRAASISSTRPRCIRSRRRRRRKAAPKPIIGNWMKARGNRDRVVLASKVVGRTDSDWFRGGAAVEAGARATFSTPSTSRCAAPDRLYRSLPDPFPRAADHLGRQPDARWAPRRPSGGRRDADRRDARRLRRAGEGRQDPAFRPLQRKLLGRDALRRRERAGHRARAWPRSRTPTISSTAPSR